MKITMILVVHTYIFRNVGRIFYSKKDQLIPKPDR